MTQPNLLPQFATHVTDIEPQVTDTQLSSKATPEITDAEIQEATKEAGMVVLDPKKIRGLAKIGRVLKRAGMVEVARGKMAARQDALERARKVLLEMIEDKVVFMAGDDKPVVHHEVVLSASNGLVAIVRAENEIDELNLQLETLAQKQAPPTAPANKLPPIEIGFLPAKQTLPEEQLGDRVPG